MSGETRAGVYGWRMATSGRSAEDSGSGEDGRPAAGWQAEACPTKAEPRAEASPTQLAPSLRDFQKVSAVPKPFLWMASARSRSAVAAERPASALTKSAGFTTPAGAGISGTESRKVGWTESTAGAMSSSISG